MTTVPVPAKTGLLVPENLARHAGPIDGPNILATVRRLRTQLAQSNNLEDIVSRMSRKLSMRSSSHLVKSYHLINTIGGSVFRATSCTAPAGGEE